jgi:protein-S-isoprenylcysteine O-methyltransferase Ste14
MASRWWLLAAPLLMLPFYLISIWREERHLAALFPHYAMYRRQKGMLFPKLTTLRGRH